MIQKGTKVTTQKLKDLYLTFHHAYADRGVLLSNKGIYRDYCFRCGDPLRVTEDRLVRINYCEECYPQHDTGLGGAGTPDLDGGPSWHNAVKAMENQ